jgi:hypothetical protein
MKLITRFFLRSLSMSLVTYCQRYVARAFMLLLVLLSNLFTINHALAQTNTIVGDVLCYQPIADVPNIARFIFGYESFEVSPVLLLPGPNNFFTPGPGNLGQITTFYPGYNRRAYRIDFDFTSTDSYSWVLQSQQYLVSLRSPKCPLQQAKPTTTPQLVSGSNQTANVNVAFAAPLRVKVVSTINGAALAGVEVRFYSPTTGASSSALGTATSDSNGLVSVNATANAIRGAYTIYAVVSQYEYATPTVSAKFLLSNL